MNFLVTGEYYRFKIVSYNAAGQSAASPSTAFTRILDAPVTTVQIYTGPPCMYYSLQPTTFVAIADGSGVYFRWTSKRGGTLGRCMNPDCSRMEYEYSNVGEIEVWVTAVNNVGSMLAQYGANVSYCGCTDRWDPNFWWLAEFHLPQSCGNTDQWPAVDTTMAVGEIKYGSRE